MRDALILVDLIHAVQTGKITNREKDNVLWLLRNNRGRLDKNALMLTELRDRVIAACPLLQEESDTVVGEVVAEGNADALTFEDQLYPDQRRGDRTNEPPTNNYGLSPIAH